LGRLPITKGSDNVPAEQTMARETQMATIVGTGEYRYRIVENWAKLPDGWAFKEVAAVAPIGVNAAGTAPADRVQGSFLGAAAPASAVQARCNRRQKNLFPNFWPPSALPPLQCVTAVGREPARRRWR
jgi:hypothetical protein